MSTRRDSSGNPPLSDERGEALLALAVSQQPLNEAHPDDDRLAAWHEGKLDPVQATQVAQHVAHCEQCFTVWSGLLALEPAAEADGATPAAGLLGRWRRLFAEPAGLRAVAGAAAAVVAAVALSVLVVEPRSALPGYSISLEGNTRYYRDGADTLPPPEIVFEQGNQFRLILTPQTAYGDAVDVALYTIAIDDTVQALATPHALVSDNGAVRIDAQVGVDVQLPAEPVDLLVVVGKAGALPAPVDVMQRLGNAGTVTNRGWQAWRIPIRAGS